MIAARPPPRKEDAQPLARRPSSPERHNAVAPEGVQPRARIRNRLTDARRGEVESAPSGRGEGIAPSNAAQSYSSLPWA